MVKMKSNKPITAATAIIGFPMALGFIYYNESHSQSSIYIIIGLILTILSMSIYLFAKLKEQRNKS
jgi:hypothetical protein